MNPARDRRTLRGAGRDLALVEAGLWILYGPAIAAAADIKKLELYRRNFEEAKAADDRQMDERERALNLENDRAHRFAKAAEGRIKEQLADLARKQADLTKRSKAVDSRERLRHRIQQLEQDAEDQLAHHTRETNRLAANYAIALETERRNYARALDILAKVPRGTHPAA